MRDSLTRREQTSRSSNAQALPAPKRTAWFWPGSALALLLPLLALGLGACCPAANPSVRPLLPQGVEPEAREQTALEQAEARWAFLDARGNDLPAADALGVAAVVLPFDDYLLLLGVLDGWRAAARAYRVAGLFQEPIVAPR